MRSRPARFLMCRPEYFAVTYAINPWMDPKGWARNRRALAAASRREGAALHHTMRDLGAAIELVPPMPGLPDLVFTANAAVVLDGKALLSRFRYPERQREQPYFENVFCALSARGLIKAVRKLPDDLVLEGAGDCVWDQARNLFWIGYGPRSDARSRHAVEEAFGVEAGALELADDRFYHMDTALCSLPRGEVMLVPSAFTNTGRAVIAARIAPSQLIEIATEDAHRLATNAVCLDDTVGMPACGRRLRAELEERGYRVVTTALRSFLRSGGAAFCLTLRLDWRIGSMVTALGESVAA